MDIHIASTDLMNLIVVMSVTLHMLNISNCLCIFWKCERFFQRKMGFFSLLFTFQNHAKSLKSFGAQSGLLGSLLLVVLDFVLVLELSYKYVHCKYFSCNISGF